MPITPGTPAVGAVKRRTQLPPPLATDGLAWLYN